MSNKAFQKLALERCHFYASQLLAVTHLSGTERGSDSAAAKNANEYNASGECFYNLVKSLRRDLLLLQGMMDE